MICIVDEIKRYVPLIEAELNNLFTKTSPVTSLLTDAELYGVMSGGKRVRPFLVLEFSRLFGGNDNCAMPFACAVELIHSYSLIHDDLPCMDDDDMRRGKPSCHKRFGEANALLAGDALLTYAFEICASNEQLSPELRTQAVVELSRAAGTFGMVGGQVIDLYGENEPLSFEDLITLHSMKTGALISACAKLGCIAAGVLPCDKRFADCVKYAECIGLTFQIIDDILDYEEGSESENKTTFLTFMSKEEAYEYAKENTNKAIDAISGYDNSERLVAFAEWLLNRKS